MSGLLSDDDTLPLHHVHSPSSYSSASDRPHERTIAGSGYAPSPGRRLTVYNRGSPYLAHADEDLLARAVQDSGLHASGCVFIEVWAVSSDGRYLARPSGGHWMDPMFIHSVEHPERAKKIAQTAPDCALGEGLVGTLFKESAGWRKRSVRWREIRSILEDPFIQQGKNERMEQLYDLGIGIVATVPFIFHEKNGIVLFMSRKSADINRLRAEHNEDYLTRATDLIGAAYAIRMPRIECSRIKSEQRQTTVEKVRKRITQRSEGDRRFQSVVREAHDAMRRRGESHVPSDDRNEEEEDGENPLGSTSSAKTNNIPESWGKASNDTFLQLAPDRFISKIHRYIHNLINSMQKWRGAGLQAAPRQSLGESMIVFTGVFCVMLAIGRVENLFKRNFESQWTFDSGIYASSLCIVFALTSAPVGQPTQIVLAHVWNALVGFAFQQIPSDGVDDFIEYANLADAERDGMVLPQAWKAALAVAFGISGQAFLGIMHPPATGLAFTFVENPEWGLSNLLMVLFGDLMMVSMSVVILNLFRTKQYPMYWFGYDWNFSYNSCRKNR